MDCPTCGLLMSVRMAGGMECGRCGDVVNVPDVRRNNLVAVYFGEVPAVEVTVAVEVKPAARPVGRRG